VSSSYHFETDVVRLLGDGVPPLEFGLTGMKLITTPDLAEPETFQYGGASAMRWSNRIEGVRAVLTAASDERGFPMEDAIRRAVAAAAEAGECRLEAWARIPAPLDGWARVTLPVFRVSMTDRLHAASVPGVVEIFHGYGKPHAEGWVQRLQVEERGPRETDETGDTLC
jgi:hypothetical protein